MFFDKVTGQLGRTIPLPITVKHRAEHNSPVAIGVRGRPARPVLGADVYHAAYQQAK
jgi:hypothetical protein